MAKNKGYMQQYAMLFGTYMGIFWILKFIFFPLGLEQPFMMLLFIGLTLYVPFMGYRYVRLYRDQACQGHIGYLKAWFFTLLIYMFAALLTAVGHYIYFRFIDNGYILQTYETLINNFPVDSMPDAASYMELFKNTLAVMETLTPLDITLQLLSQNVYAGMLLAFPTALFVMRRKKPTNQSI